MKYKPGDAIMFVKDVLTEPAKRANNSKPYRPQAEKSLLIPKLVPCTVEKINKNHIWVKYKNTVHWLRYIESRMIPATEAGIILFGEVEDDEGYTKRSGAY